MLPKKMVSDYKLKLADIMHFSKESEHGLTEDELKDYFGSVVMKKFLQWGDGQTCAVTEDRKIVFFPEDINAFVCSLVVVRG